MEKIVIPHPAWKVMDYSPEDMIRLAGKGAYLEHCIGACDPQQSVSRG